MFQAQQDPSVVYVLETNIHHTHCVLDPHAQMKVYVEVRLQTSAILCRKKNNRAFTNAYLFVDVDLLTYDLLDACTVSLIHKLCG